MTEYTTVNGVRYQRTKTWSRRAGKWTYSSWVRVSGSSDGGNTPASGNTSPSSSGSTSSSGTPAKPGLSTYTQAYRLMFGRNVRPPRALLKQAKDGKWSISYFQMQVRLRDKNYINSLEAKRRLVGEKGFRETMKVAFPELIDEKRLMKTKFYKRLALNFLRHGWTQEDLLRKVAVNRRFLRQNPEYRAYVRGQAALGETQINPLVFRQHQEALKSAFGAYGLDMGDDYYKTFFKSRYASQGGLQTLQQNLKDIAESRGAQEWFQGRAVDAGQIKTAALEAGTSGTDLRARFQRSLGTQKSFVGAEQRSFETQLSKQGKLVRPLI